MDSIQLAAEAFRQICPESAISLMSSANRDGASAIGTYLVLVQRSLDGGRPGSIGDANGRPFRADEIATALRLDKRRAEREISLMREVGLVSVDEGTDAVFLPKVADAVMRITDLAGSKSPTMSLSECEAAKESKVVSEDEFRTYFRQMRVRGQRDATPENEDKFWQYLVAAGFRKMGGDPITKTNLPSSFIAWMRNRRRDEAEKDAKAQAQAEAAAQAEKEAEESRNSSERLNDMLLRGEEFTNWDDE